MGISAGKQGVPDTNVGDISEVNRSKVGVKDRPKGVVKHGQSRKFGGDLWSPSGSIYLYSYDFQKEECLH